MRTRPLKTFRRRTRERDERGAVVVLAAGGLVLAMTFASFAVDLGSLMEEARRNQKVADLAALDAARVFPTGYVAEAADSAARNRFPTGAGYSVTTVEGVKVGGNCQAQAGAGTVCVTATSPHSNFFPFVPGGQRASRSAVAGVEDKAQFSVGSKLATLNLTDNILLNKVMTEVFGTSPVAMNLTVVGYQGLAGGTVSLADLVAADPSLGSPDALLTSSVSMRRIALATLTALNSKGDAASLAAATPLAIFANNIKSSFMVNLGDILAIQQPASPGSVAAQTQFNVFDLLTGAGEAAIFNGTNVVTIPNLTVSVPGLASASLKLTVVEPPKISAFGPARYDSTTLTWATTARTAQVKVELTSHIQVGTTPCSGLLVTCVDMTMPLVLSAARATGSLTDVRCPAASSTRQADVRVVTEAANATAVNVLTVKQAGVDLVPPLSVVRTNVPIAGGTTTPDMTFSGPPFPTAMQSTSATGAGLATATTSQLTLLGVLPVGPVLSLVSPVTSAIDAEILAPMFNALGLSVGGADVRTLRVECGVPGLLG